jgi:hypothetical protein
MQASQTQDISVNYEQRRHTRIVILPQCETQKAFSTKQQLPSWFDVPCNAHQ